MLKSIALWNYGSDQLTNARALHALGFEAFSFLGRLFDAQTPEKDETTACLVAELGSPMTIHHRFPAPEQPDAVDTFLKGMDHIRRWQDKYGLLTTLTFDFNHPVDQLAPLLGRMIRLFRGSGVTLACEDHPLKLAEAQHFSPLLTREDRFGLLIDTGHMNLRHTRWGKTSPQDVTDALRALPLPLLEVHLSGNHGKQDEHLPPEQGTFPMETFVQGLKSIGFDGWCTIERVPRGEEWQASLQRSRNSMAWFMNLWA